MKFCLCKDLPRAHHYSNSHQVGKRLRLVDLPFSKDVCRLGQATVAVFYADMSWILKEKLFHMHSLRWKSIKLCTVWTRQNVKSPRYWQMQRSIPRSSSVKKSFQEYREGEKWTQQVMSFQGKLKPVHAIQFVLKPSRKSVIKTRRVEWLTLFF